MKSKDVSEQKKNELTEVYNSLNPFELKKAIKNKVDRIFRLINKNYDKKMCYK